MKWFKHDSTANMDAKLQEVLLDYGLEGYGLYWYCLELIAGKVEPGNLTFELEHDCRIIARNTGSTAQRVQEMMTRFVDLGLFENAQGTITCLKMAKVSDDYTAKLIRSEQSAKKPQVVENKGVLQSPTNSEKVSLEENRTEENRTDNNNSIGTSADAPMVVDQCDASPVSKQETAKAAKPYPDEFEWIWKHKPERAGGNGKKSAYNACRARIKAGATWRELAEGVKRYAAHCKSEGKIGTPYVMQMTTFFGPDEHFRNEWKAAAKPASFPEHSGPDRSITIIEARQAVSEMTQEDKAAIAKTREELKKLTEKL